LKDDDKFELDFTKSIEKKPDTKKTDFKKSYNSRIEINNNVGNKFDQIKQSEMLRESHRIQKNSLMFRLFVSLLIISAYYFLMYKYMVPIQGKRVLIKATIGLVIYSVVAYLIRPKPDMNNLGYFGGLINRPFDYTDDWNRFLLNLKVLLLPGVIISEAIVDLFSKD